MNMDYGQPIFQLHSKNFRLRADGEMTGLILLSYFGIYIELLFWMKMIAKTYFVIVIERYDSFIIYEYIFSYEHST